MRASKLVISVNTYSKTLLILDSAWDDKKLEIVTDSMRTPGRTSISLAMNGKRLFIR